MSDQSKTAISTKEAPAAIGPYSPGGAGWGYVVCFGAGGAGSGDGTAGCRWVTEQTVRVLENVKAVLAKAGLDHESMW